MNRALGAAILIAVLPALAVACGSAAEATPSPTITPAPASAAHRLFITKGCAACHGPNAEGTNVAPALAGHTVGQVKRQVRAPVGLMPVFPPDKVSSDELEAIASYVSGLTAEHAHQRPVDPGMVVEQHHWMALFALEDGEQKEAIHHLNHIIELVLGDHLVRMQQALSEINQGQLHSVAHIVVEQMLAGIAPPELTRQGLHLQLAISATRVEDAANAIHHVEHYLELAEANSKEAALAQGILALLKAGKLAEAEHELAGLSGGLTEDHHQGSADTEAHPDRGKEQH